MSGPVATQAAKSGRVKRMVRLAAELLLLLGLLLLTLHITVLRSSPLPQSNDTVVVVVDQDAALREVSQWRREDRGGEFWGVGGNLIQPARGLILVADGLDKIPT